MSDTIDLGIEHLDGIEAIGRGGFSTVYAATDTRFERQVAVKVLAPLSDEADRRRFDRECRVMGRLSSHPNVVTVYDAGFTPDERPYLIMELVAGGSLADVVEQRGRVPWDRAVDYIIEVASALEQAHGEGILHRDIKPANILLNGDRPLLTDFGIAYLRDATGTASKEISASMLHAPPETFENARDERSDLYSLTSTLYTLVSGESPFSRATDESIGPVIYRILHEHPPLLAPGLVPPALQDFLRRGLAKDPSGRPQTARELSDWLKRIQDNPAAASDTVIGAPPGTAPAPGDPFSTRSAYPSDVGSGGVGGGGGVAPPPAYLADQPTVLERHGQPGQPGRPHPPGRPVVTEAQLAQPPGWYYAMGDPPGSQRWWDGVQWAGRPQPVSVPLRGVPLVAPLFQLAGVGARIGAYLIDVVVMFVILMVGTMVQQQVGIGEPDGAGIGFLAMFVFGFWNSCFQQGRTGQTIGKKLVHIQLVSDRTGGPVGVGAATARPLLNWVPGLFSCLVFTVLNLLWPLWDPGKKRLTDKMMHLSVIPVD